MFLRVNYTLVTTEALVVFSVCSRDIGAFSLLHCCPVHSSPVLYSHRYEAFRWQIDSGSTVSTRDLFYIAIQLDDIFQTPLNRTNEATWK